MRKRKLIMFLTLLMVIGINTAVAVSGKHFGPLFMERMMVMRDGVRLYTRIYLPGQGEYPVILMRTPYGIGTPTWEGGERPGPEDWPDEVQFFILDGYACVEQDTRGRYYSGDVDRLFYNDGEDGYDTIEWIAGQSWCNGKVGMAGYSAPGITTFLAAGENPPHLKAIVPAASSGNLMNDLTFDGGVFHGDCLLWGFGQTLEGLSKSHLLYVMRENRLTPKELEEYFLDANETFTDLLTHVYPWPGTRPVDSQSWMHLPLKDYPYITVLQPYTNEILSHPNEDEWRNHYKAYNTVDVPTLLMTGWYDFFVKCQIDAFVALQERGIPVRLYVGPGTHEDLGLPGGVPGILTLALAWFNFWLKGIDNGIMDGPPILYYSLEANKWRMAEQWPPQGAEYTRYYLHDGGSLSTNPCVAEEEPDTYVYDPMNPVLTWGGTNQPFPGAIPAGPFDQTPVVFDLVTGQPRDDILSYTSETLAEPVEISGPLRVVLGASSNCTDTDFTAKLIDIHPPSRTNPSPQLNLVADGIIRARFRCSMATPELMEPHSVYKFTIDLGDISHMFKEGHQIRVDISSSNFPRFDRNLNTGGPLYQETVICDAENTVYHNSTYESYIELPIMPQAGESFMERRAPRLSSQHEFRGGLCWMELVGICQPFALTVWPMKHSEKCPFLFLPRKFQVG